MSIAEIALLEGRYPAATRVISPTPWAPLTPIINGWSPGIPAPEFRIDAQGTVYLRGSVGNGAIPAVFANMPAGFEPALDTTFPCVTVDTLGPTVDSGVITVLNAAGAMTIVQGIASPDIVALDGISWSVFV